MIFDLIVIGGGPAGCSAAITAARHSAKVLLLERGHFPRHKVCGEFVSAESLELLKDLLAPNHHPLITDAPRINRSRIFLDNAELDAKINPPAASITRFDLDSALWQSALSSGVDARGDCQVQAVEGTGPFTVVGGGNVVEGRAVINATGRWSNLTSPATRARASTSKDRPENRWIGIKAHFREASPSPSPSVDLYFFEGGYCGVQPITCPQNGSGTVVNACAMVQAEAATTLQEVFRAHPALRDRSTRWTPLMAPVTTSPLVFHPPELVHRGMLQAGDTATFVDPFIGDGISLALRSGAMAADCLAPFFRSQCSLEQAALEYCNSYQRELAPVFRASSKLRHMLRWRSVVRKPVLSLLQRTPAMTSLLVKMTR